MAIRGSSVGGLTRVYIIPTEMFCCNFVDQDPDTHAFKGPMRFHEKMRYLPLHKLQSHV